MKKLLSCGKTIYFDGEDKKLVEMHKRLANYSVNLQN